MSAAESGACELHAERAWRRQKWAGRETGKWTLKLGGWQQRKGTVGLYKPLLMTPIVCCWMKMRMITLNFFSKINIYNCGGYSYVICFGSVSSQSNNLFNSDLQGRLCLPAAADFSVLKPSTPTAWQEEVKLVYYLPASLDLTVRLKKAIIPTKYLICCSWYLNHLTICVSIY